MGFPRGPHRLSRFSCRRTFMTRTHLLQSICILAIMVLLLPGLPARAQSDDQFSDSLERLANGPGIQSLMRCPWDTESVPPRREDRLLLVIVEARLLPLVDAPILADGSASQPRLSAFTVWDLSPALKQWRGDLMAAGFAPRFVRLQLAPAARSILGLRSLIGGVRSANPALAGVILVGSFPQARIERRRITAAATVDGNKELQIFPRPITTRADIVLADFDADWAKLYVDGTRSVPTLELVPDNPPGNWPASGQILESSRFSFANTTIQNCFYIQDDTYVAPAGFDKPKLKLKIDLGHKHPEIGGRDRSGLNPVARPDFPLSRIDARAAAVDERGQHDFVLERRLLVEYFERLHELRSRSGRGTEVAVISAPADGRGIAERRPVGSVPLRCADATLADFIRWLALPARTRIIEAPAERGALRFGTAYSPSSLELLSGTRRSVDGRFDAALARTLWRSGHTAASGGLYLLTRDAGSADGFAPENALFLLNGQAVIAYSSAVGEIWLPGQEGSVGEAWLGMFQRESNRTPDATAADAKRAYAWTLSGDWTLFFR